MSERKKPAAMTPQRSSSEDYHHCRQSRRVASTTPPNHSFDDNEAMFLYYTPPREGRRLQQPRSAPFSELRHRSYSDHGTSSSSLNSPTALWIDDDDDDDDNNEEEEEQRGEVKGGLRRESLSLFRVENGGTDEEEDGEPQQFHDEESDWEEGMELPQVRTNSWGTPLRLMALVFVVTILAASGNSTPKSAVTKKSIRMDSEPAAHLLHEVTFPLPQETPHDIHLIHDNSKQFIPKLQTPPDSPPKTPANKPKDSSTVTTTTTTTTASSSTEVNTKRFRPRLYHARGLDTPNRKFVLKKSSKLERFVPKPAPEEEEIPRGHHNYNLWMDDRKAWVWLLLIVLGLETAYKEWCRSHLYRSPTFVFCGCHSSRRRPRRRGQQQQQQQQQSQRRRHTQQQQRIRRPRSL